MEDLSHTAYEDDRKIQLALGDLYILKTILRNDPPECCTWCSHLPWWQKYLIQLIAIILVAVVYIVILVVEFDAIVGYQYGPFIYCYLPVLVPLVYHIQLRLGIIHHRINTLLFIASRFKRIKITKQMLFEHKHSDNTYLTLTLFAITNYSIIINNIEDNNQAIFLFVQISLIALLILFHSAYLYKTHFPREYIKCKFKLILRFLKELDSLINLKYLEFKKDTPSPKSRVPSRDEIQKKEADLKETMKDINFKSKDDIDFFNL